MLERRNMPAPERKNALYLHCVEVYGRMLQESEPYDDRDNKCPPIPQVVGVGIYEARETLRLASVGIDEGPRIYTGYLTKLFKDLCLAVPYYTSVMDALKRMRCVDQLKRGGGAKPSQWALWQPPDRMIFNNAMAQTKLDAAGTHKSTKEKILEQRIADLDREIRNQHNRIVKLEIQLEGEGA